MWKKITRYYEGGIDFKPAQHLAPCEDCGSILEMGKCDTSHCGPEVKDRDRHAVIRCPNCDTSKTSSVKLSLTGAEIGLLTSGVALLGWDAHMINRKYQEHRQKKKENKKEEEDNEKEANIKTADADIIQFPVFDDETHERITNAINEGHMCHFGVPNCGYNKGYLEGRNHPELGSINCPVHSPGGAMDRHPAGTGQGDRKLDRDNTELANVIPIKRKGNMMSNEFSNRQDEDSFGLWYDEDDFKKTAQWWNPATWGTGYSPEEEAASKARQQAAAEVQAEDIASGGTAYNAETAGVEVDERSGTTNYRDRENTALTGTGVTNTPAANPQAAGSPKPAVVNKAIKSLTTASKEELPQWIEDAKQKIAHDHSEWQAEQARDEDVNRQIDDRKFERGSEDSEEPGERGCPFGECDMSADEHCEECQACPGDYHGDDCSKSDSDDYNDSMDGDFDSAMTSAGFGTDEDYGYYGGDEW